MSVAKRTLPADSPAQATATYLVEVGCPPGHVNFIGGLLREYQRQDSNVFLVTYDQYRHSIPGSEASRSISLGPGPPVAGSAIGRKILMLRSVRRFLRQVRSGKLVFLSYDPFVMQYFHFDRRSAVILEHNNVDRAERSTLYRLAYRLLPDRLVHSCFEPYIAEYIRERYGKKAVVANFPARKIVPSKLSAVDEARRRYGRFCFAPTPSADTGFVATVATQLVERGLRLVTRNSLSARAGSVLEHPNISILHEPYDYDALLLASEAVAILNEYQYRVSGVFTEALACRKPVFMRDCLFARQATVSHPAAQLTILRS